MIQIVFLVVCVMMVVGMIYLAAGPEKAPGTASVAEKEHPDAVLTQDDAA